MITATETAIVEMIDSGTSFSVVGADVSSQIESSLHNSGLDCATSAEYSYILVDPTEIQVGTNSVDDALLTDPDPLIDNKYDSIFELMATETDLVNYQDNHDADVVILLTGNNFDDSAAGRSFTSAAGVELLSTDTGNTTFDVADDSTRMWSVLKWNNNTTIFQMMENAENNGVR